MKNRFLPEVSSVSKATGEITSLQSNTLRSRQLCGFFLIPFHTDLFFLDVCCEARLEQRREDAGTVERWIWCPCPPQNSPAS